MTETTLSPPSTSRSCYVEAIRQLSVGEWVVTYKKVFTTSRYQAKSQNSFSSDARLKRVLIGSRGNPDATCAYLGKVIEQGKTGNLLDFEVHCDVSFPHV